MRSFSQCSGPNTWWGRTQGMAWWRRGTTHARSARSARPAGPAGSARWHVEYMLPLPLRPCLDAHRCARQQSSHACPFRIHSRILFFTAYHLLHTSSHPTSPNADLSIQAWVGCEKVSSATWPSEFIGASSRVQCISGVQCVLLGKQKRIRNLASSSLCSAVGFLSSHDLRDHRNLAMRRGWACDGLLYSTKPLPGSPTKRGLQPEGQN